MQKITDLGTVKVKHISNMVETDKGFRMPADNSVTVGDQLIEVDGQRKFVSKDEFPEIRKEIAKQEKEAPKASKPGKNDSAALIAAQEAVDLANANALKEKAEADAAKEALAAANEKLAALERAEEAHVAEGAK